MIAKLILPDDLSVSIEHKSWHGKQPTTSTAVTLYVATNLGLRMMRPGMRGRTVTEVCGAYHLAKMGGKCTFRLAACGMLFRLLGLCVAADSCYHARAGGRGLWRFSSDRGGNIC